MDIKNNKQLNWSVDISIDGSQVYKARAGAMLCYTIIESDNGNAKNNGGKDKYYLGASTESFQKNVKKQASREKKLLFRIVRILIQQMTHTQMPWYDAMNFVKRIGQKKWQKLKKQKNLPAKNNINFYQIKKNN